MQVRGGAAGDRHGPLHPAGVVRLQEPRGGGESVSQDWEVLCGDEVRPPGERHWILHQTRQQTQALILITYRNYKIRST